MKTGGSITMPIDISVELTTRSMTRDRKSTRLNSSHSQISYAVFCLKKKKTRRADDDRHTDAVRRRRPGPADGAGLEPPDGRDHPRPAPLRDGQRRATRRDPPRYRTI